MRDEWEEGGEGRKSIGILLTLYLPPQWFVLPLRTSYSMELPSWKLPRLSSYTSTTTFLQLLLSPAPTRNWVSTFQHSELRNFTRSKCLNSLGEAWKFRWFGRKDQTVKGVGWQMASKIWKKHSFEHISHGDQKNSF